MYRTEIRRRNCRRPTSRDSGSANSPPTSCAPCRQTPATQTIHNRRSKKPADRARAEEDRRRQRSGLPLPRQEFPNAGSAEWTSNTENDQRPTPNVQRRTQRERISFGLLSAVRMLATKIRISSSTSLRQTVKFAGVPRFFTRPTSRNQRFVSRSSLRQIRSL